MDKYKKIVFCGKIAITTFKLIRNPKVGGVSENSGYLALGTEIFKIEEKMTEKMKPKVANPPQKMGRIHCSQYALPLLFHDL